MLHPEKQKLTTARLLRFVLPSLLGIFLFLIPIPYQGHYMISVARLAQCLAQYSQPFLPTILLALFCIAAIGSIISTLFRPAFMQKHPSLTQLFILSPTWLIVRCIAALWALALYYQKGPSLLINPETAAMIWHQLLPTLIINLLVSSLFVPLLLDFGLLECVGIMIAPIMRPLFKLPGEAGLNAIIAWVGDGSFGSLLALQQYEEKKYTPRETMTFITSFAAPSITFCLSVLAQVQLASYFLPFYGTLTISIIVAAILLPRIPPLVWQKHHPSPTPSSPTPHTLPRWQRALYAATDRAHQRSFTHLISLQHFYNLFSMLLSLLPSVLFIGGVSLMIAHHTPLFVWLGKPFISILRLSGVPDAEAVSQTLFIGFTDMLLPALMISKTHTMPISRFIVAALSITQIIYLSELGALLMSSKLRFPLYHLLFIFLLRTLITLPIIILCAHFIFS